MSDTTRNKQLNFNSLFVVLILLASVIVVMTVFFDGLSKKRAKNVYDMYAAESNVYIEKNRTGLIEIFTAMQNTSCPNNGCTAIKSEEVMGKITNDLTDFSSTAFVAINPQGEVMLQKLSGDRELMYFNETGAIKMKELINGTVSQLPWDDYLYFYQGKEVVVPVKDAGGKITGLLVRSAVAK